MNLLAIDASTDLATVALMVEGKTSFKAVDAIRQHAQLLLPMIESLLKEQSLKYPKLDGIVLGRGPGSFTGLRIAFSIAKALAFAWDLPIYPVSCLAAIAHDTYQQFQDLPRNTQVLSIMDARMKELYSCCYLGEKALSEERVSAARDIVIPANAPLVLAGNGLEEYREDIPRDIRSRIIKEYSCKPSASTLIELVFKEGIQAISPSEALPLYIRNQVTHGAANG